VMDIPLNNLSYHLREMLAAEVLDEPHGIPKRGAYERIYSSEVVGNEFVESILAATEAQDQAAEKRWRDRRETRIRKANEDENAE
jgi:hypothetical protein